MKYTHHDISYKGYTGYIHKHVWLITGDFPEDLQDTERGSRGSL